MQARFASSKTVRAPGIARGPCAAAPKSFAQNGSRGAAVMAAASTTWDKWADSIDAAKKAAGAKPPPVANPATYAALAKAVTAAAAAYVPASRGAPKLSVAFDALHGNLEKVALECLRQFLAVPEGKPLEAKLQHFTTTDISAALQIAGVKIQKGSTPYAVFSAVVTETSGQVSWSRLENLILHWATQAAPGADWAAAPSGWKTDVGGDEAQGTVWDSYFEKHPLEGAAGNEAMYTLVMQLPLTGSLAAGGVVFVMKGESGSQPTRWLKEAKSQSDFFLDLQKFPAMK